MHNDSKKKQSFERKPVRDGGQASETPPRRRRGPYGPIRSGRYAQRTPRSEG